MDEFLSVLDEQAAVWAQRLTQFGVGNDRAKQVASTVFREVAVHRDAIKTHERSVVPAQRQLHLLENLQMWRMFQHQAPTRFLPQRAQEALRDMMCVPDLYVTCVYLRDGLFRAVAETVEAGSAAERCARYIVQDPSIGMLRNAVAHGTWDFAEDGLTIWDGRSHTSQSQVSERDLSFQMMLVRTVGWSALLALSE